MRKLRSASCLFALAAFALVLGCSNASGSSDLPPAAPTVPSISTDAVSVADNTAVIGGTIASDGGSVLLSEGIVWSTSPNPTLQANEGRIAAAAGQTAFSCPIAGLQLSTTYYFRSYATNAVGAAYGSQFQLATAALAAAWDWRNVQGANYVTPVKDTAQTGNVWAAAPIDMLESRLMIERHSLSPTPSFSWQDVAANATGPDGLKMTNGGYPYYALLYCKQTGVLPSSGGPRFLIKNCASDSAYTAAALKSEIETHGPVTASLAQYSSFSNYASGVYNPPTSGALGTSEGTTTVSIVGYSDAGQYWIIKNTWDTWWGESGYARVGYAFAAGTGGLLAHVVTAVASD